MQLENRIIYDISVVGERSQWIRVILYDEIHAVAATRLIESDSHYTELMLKIGATEW
jgi:hypothetical protein